MYRVVFVLLLLAGQAYGSDFNRDGKVDFSDFVLFAQAYGSAEVFYDLDGDGKVGQGDYILFAKSFNQSVSAAKKTTTPEELERAAKEYWESGNYRGSIQKYEEFLEAVKDPDLKADALKNIGLAYMQMGNLDEASKNLRKLIQDYEKGEALGEILKGHLADSYIALGHIQALQNNRKQAVLYLNQALSQLPPFTIKE